MDQSRFDLFFVETFPTLARALSAMTGISPHEGEDLAQEAMVRVLLRWDRLESESEARRLCYAAGWNLARSQRRRARILQRILPTLHARTSEASHGNDPATLLVETAMSDLSPRQRTVFVLTAFADLPATEVGGILGISPATVRVHLHDARQRLIKEMQLSAVEERTT